MKLLNFKTENGVRLGVVTERGVLDVARALDTFPAESETPVPVTVHQVIEGGQDAVRTLERYAKQLTAEENGHSGLWLQEEELEWAASVTNPDKIICVGLNYRKHAQETGAQVPEYPILFNKFNNAIAAHGEDIPLPRVSDKVDYEAELVIVIGKEAKYVPQEQALDYVFGYCAANDLSARDLQMRTPQWLLGKSCDKFSPLGPYLVTADEVGDPNQLEIKCSVNGEIRQHSNTSDMIFGVEEIVSYISQHMTLVPGDIILTGTPEGVVLGYPPEKQIYLKAGDIVTIEIEKLGTLTNRMAAEQN
ncbi:fumarylacetoacetate hydrolase family protein [Paenibacillus sp. YPG26]|uniref:fumarylacetoacetate hydrolase family protein n=1 Tax=Paenibacillus sp. YPG26 TaxID=2878915 RepID=UPI00203B1034|nr:fumarylacetoacetate hydrolase family protein [Paenibacillus sp. YPG26]USB32642.1 fumarylacetoacetate hydrolase family protein [Paenibacillus sp. YPG26]